MQGGAVDLGCGGVEMLCVEPAGAAVSEGNLAFVGQGRGNYEMVTNVQYVGPGGSYASKKTGGTSYCFLLCSFLAFILLLAGLVLLVWLLLHRGSQSAFEEDVRTISEAFDCEAGLLRWQSGWSIQKKTWCCNHKNRGCAITSTGEPYECQAGLSNWKAGWSRGKKLWCCTMKNLGCPELKTSEPFDCNAGFINWQNGWAPAKKSWCCAHYNKGCAVKKSCTLWGDPHIFNFDHSRTVFYSEGDFWIVKSPSLNIQGRFQATDWTRKNDKTDYSSMTKIVVGGAINQHHKLVVGPTEGGKITCDGAEILHQFGYTRCGAATVTFDTVGQLVDSAMAFLPHRVVHIRLPNGVEIQVNRWTNFINSKIMMMPVQGQTGICGNFNGVKKAGLRAGKELHELFGYGVPAHELMFSDAIPLHIPTAMPSNKRCSEEKRTHAEDICKAQVGQSWSLAECIGDVCDPHPGNGMTSFTAAEMHATMSN